MLASLYPRFSRDFGELVKKSGLRKRAHDPLIRHYVGEYRAARPGKDDRYVLARWFFEGEYVTALSETLNNVMKESNEGTRFDSHDRDASSETFWAIAKSIDNGLPVILGWNTADYGNHAVLVTGYWHGVDDWLLLNDPGGDTEISWQVLRKAVEDKLDVLTCIPKTHFGPRPDKAVTSKNERVEFHRWMPDKSYVPLDELFGLQKPETD